MTSRAAPAISIVAVDADKNEGNSGATSFTFALGRAVGPLTPADGVTWTATGFGAHPADPADFAGPLTGTINFLTATDDALTNEALIAGSEPMGAEMDVLIA